jgi:pimeloyl-ACP methyl ester carboxylesterase
MLWAIINQHNMKHLLLLITLFLLLNICQSANTYDKRITGLKWEGFLKVENIDLKLIFKFNEDKCLLEVPAQALADCPSSTYKIMEDSLCVTFSGLFQASFKGRIQGDTLILGNWLQMGKVIPVSLKKKREYNRPQNPTAPYPYKIEEVAYYNPDKSIRFGGTLTIPLKGERHPVAILITGSEQEDRDETIFGHKPFLVIADYLTRHGIAVLRVDDRGIGATTGNETIMNATSNDFAKDVSAGIDYLKKRKDIDSVKIGLIGHSEGGVIASIIGAERNDVAFIVSMAGVGVAGKDFFLSQIETGLKRVMLQTSVDSIMAFENKSLETILNEQNNRSAEVLILQRLSSKWLANQDSSTKKYFGVYNQDGFQAIKTKEVSLRYNRLMQPWYRYCLSYSPASVCSRIKAPFLAINGEKDKQVLAKLNLNGFDKIFTDSHKTNYKIISYPELNHFFQHCKDGYMEEVESIEETISQDVLRDMTNWINNQIENKKNSL